MQLVSLLARQESWRGRKPSRIEKRARKSSIHRWHAISHHDEANNGSDSAGCERSARFIHAKRRSQRLDEPRPRLLHDFPRVIRKKYRQRSDRSLRPCQDACFQSRRGRRSVFFLFCVFVRTRFRFFSTNGPRRRPFSSEIRSSESTTIEVSSQIKYTFHA